MVEMSVLFEGCDAWFNFGRTMIVDAAHFFDEVNVLLKPYRARLDLKKQSIIFDTEQDKLFFMLKWS
jgi:hypothetical protein